MDEQAAGNEANADVIASIDQVQLGVEKVEFWACAFSGLVSPVPEYDLDQLGPRLRAA